MAIFHRAFSKSRAPKRAVGMLLEIRLFFQAIHVLIKMSVFRYVQPHFGIVTTLQDICLSFGVGTHLYVRILKKPRKKHVVCVAA